MVGMAGDRDGGAVPAAVVEDVSANRTRGTMSETKHTPLPWRLIDERDEEYAGAVIVNEGGHIIADCNIFGGDNPTPERECFANAELIVTAVNAGPKVEELVGRILQFIAPSDGYIIEPTLAEWKNLVQKARDVEAVLDGKADVDLEAHERDLERRAGCGGE